MIRDDARDDGARDIECCCTKNPVGEAMSFARARQSQPDRLGTVRAFYASAFQDLFKIPSRLYFTGVYPLVNKT